VARGSLAKPAVVTNGCPTLCNGRLERNNRARFRDRRLGNRDPINKESRTAKESGTKKARLGSRADKGLEIFFVNEKVCFGKQKPEYKAGLSENWRRSRQSSIAAPSTIINFHRFVVVFSRHLM
jgi:hypothetical protein